MMTDELILRIDKFETDIGKATKRIFCGKAAFEKLCREAIDDRGANRYLEPNSGTGYVAKFMGIPIQIIHNTNVLEDDKIYLVPGPDEDCYEPIHETPWRSHRPYNNLFVDDLVPRDVVVQNEEEPADIDEVYFMSVLNGYHNPTK